MPHVADSRCPPTLEPYRAHANDRPPELRRQPTSQSEPPKWPRRGGEERSSQNNASKEVERRYQASPLMAFAGKSPSPERNAPAATTEPAERAECPPAAVAASPSTRRTAEVAGRWRPPPALKTRSGPAPAGSSQGAAGSGLQRGAGEEDPKSPRRRQPAERRKMAPPPPSLPLRGLSDRGLRRRRGRGGLVAGG